jgi:hypothetical protein
LFGLSLDIRELIGVACRRKGQDGRCRYESPFHVKSPNKGAAPTHRELPKSTEPRRELPRLPVCFRGFGKAVTRMQHPIMKLRNGETPTKMG